MDLEVVRLAPRRARVVWLEVATHRVESTAYRYRPPAGTVLVLRNRRGLAVVDGLFVVIEGPDERTILQAARSLRPRRG